MIAIYARQSVDKKDSISIESQIEFCKKEFDASTENYKVYADKGFSGKNINRPQFSEMLSNIKEGLIDRVIIYKLDRISRSTLDFANIIDIFKKHNVEFTSCTEKFDTSTPIGKAMLQIIMVFAELERETIQQRVTDNYYERGKKGFFLGGTVPYGFKKIPVTINGKRTSALETILEETKVLNIIFDQYSNTNLSLGKISDYLNSKNIPAPKGGKWDSNKISRILRNPIYVRADADVYQYYKNKGVQISNKIEDFIGKNGCYLFGKREANERKYTNVENHILTIGLHEGIVDSHTWLMCQYKLDSNKQIKNSGKGKHSWLSGLAKCGYCGYAVSVVISNTKEKYKYFNCRGKTNLRICQGHSRPIKVSEIENIVEHKLFEKIDELKHYNFVYETKEASDINNIKMEIARIDEQIDNLISQLAEANDIVVKYVNKKVTELDARKSQLLDEMKKATINNSKVVSAKEAIEQIQNWDEMDIEKKKEIAKLFISKVRIKDDEIEVEWVI